MKMSSWRSWVLPTLVLFLFAPATVHAQSQAAAATVEGYVYDPSGAVVQDAAVTAINTGTGLSRSVKSGNDGHFLIPALPPGNYVLTIAKAGFAELKLENVLLRVGDSVSLEGNLKPVQLQEETTVIAESDPIIETTRTQPGTVIERNIIDALPLNGRNWTDLVLLTPGVTNDGEFGNVSFGGVDRVFNNIQVDGADNNNSFYGEIRGRTRAPFQFSQETVQEFRVANNNFSAEFGRAAGGIVNAVTRSGSNTWRGSGFYYLRDDFFNANNFFNNANRIPRPAERRQQFGGNIGGPLKKDKLFLFFNYDQQVRNEPLSVILGARLERDISLLGPAQRAQAEVLLRPFVRSVPRNFDQINFFPRVDWNINTNHNLTVTHNFQRFSSFNGFLTPPTTTSNDTGNSENFTNSYTTVFTLNSVFTPSLVNEFRYNLVFDDTGDRAKAPLLPRISFSGFDLGGDTRLQGPPGAFPGRFTFERRHQFVDNLSLLRSKHTLKFGFDINRVVDRNQFSQNVNGSYSFTDVANFLLQNLSSYSQRFFVGSPVVRQLTVQYGLYGQDSFRIRSRVTLYYGVRYELQTLPQPLIPNPLEPLTARFNVDTNNIEPRFGFAISPTKDNKTVIRGGYGIFHGLTPNLLVNDFITSNNAYAFDIFLSGDALLANGISFPPVSQLNLVNLASVTFPRLSQPPGGINFANPTGDITVSAPDRVNPYTEQGNLEIERELPGRLSVSAAYLVTRGVHIGRTRNINVIPPNGTATIRLVDAGGKVVESIPFPRIGVTFAALRPDPNFRQILMVESAANSIYHAFALRVNRRFARGFSMLGSYTLSKNIDDIRNSLGGFSDILDPYDSRLDRGLSSLDQRHRLVFSGIWDLPFFKSANHAAIRYALGGWSLSGIATIGSGRPVTADVNGLSSSTTDTDFNEDNVTFDRAPIYGRNIFTGPARTPIDLSMRKIFRIGEKRRFEFVAQAFNLLNQPQFTSVVNTAFDSRRTGGINNRVFTLTRRSDFLTPTAALRGRDLQFGFKFTY